MSEQPIPQPDRQVISWDEALKHKQGDTAEVAVGGEVVAPQLVEQVPEVSTEHLVEIPATEAILEPEVAQEVVVTGQTPLPQPEVVEHRTEPIVEALHEEDTQPALPATEGTIIPDASAEIHAAVGNPTEENLVALSQAAHH